MGDKTARSEFASKCSLDMCIDCKSYNYTQVGKSKESQWIVKLNLIPFE